MCLYLLGFRSFVQQDAGVSPAIQQPAWGLLAQ